nr:putative reverse transcriptase domain-containing protein [Tanacetum cinerariifolium]
MLRIATVGNGGGRVIGSAIPTDPQHIPTLLQPSSSQPQKTQKPRKAKRKDTQVPQLSGPTESVANEAIYKELDDHFVRDATTTSSLEAEQDNGNTLQSDKDRLKLNKLMKLCTTLQSRVLDLEKTKTTQALEIDSLKRRVKKLEKKQKSRTHKLKRLYKVGLSARVELSNDNEDLGEDASKQGRKIHDIDADEDIILVNDQDDEQMFDVNDLQEQRQSYYDRKTCKAKEKDQIMLDEEVALKLQAELQAEFDKEQRLASGKDQQEEEVNKEQQQLTDAEKATLFMQFLEKRRKFFAAKAAEEKRNKPPTQAQQRKIMSIDDDKETAKLKQLVKIIQDDEGVAIDVIPLAIKPLTIVDWKIHKEGKKSYYKIIRADGSSKIYLVFSHMLKSFNREDVETLWKLHRWIELFSDYDCEIRFHPGKANVVADALSRKESVKPKRVRSMNMTLWSSIKDMILAAQKEDVDESARLHKGKAMNFMTKLPKTSSGHDTIWVIVDRLTKSAYFLPMREDYKINRLARLYLNKIVARHGVPISIISDRDSRFTSRFWQSMQEALGSRLDMSTAYHPQTDGQRERTIQTLEEKLRACVLDFGGSWDVHLPKCRLQIMWVEVGEGQLIGPELVQETTEKISQMKDRIKAARVVRFGKKGKLAPRFFGPLKIIEKVGPVAYRLDLIEELDGVHDTFHVSNLKKCLADPTLQVPLDEIQVDANLNFMKEPVEILKREFKKLKRSRIAIVKVRWNSKCGPEFTWKREDQMKLKYPHLFSDVSS